MSNIAQRGVQAGALDRKASGEGFNGPVYSRAKSGNRRGNQGRTIDSKSFILNTLR